MTNDSASLQRFVEAQKSSYEQALNELKKGRKTSHWMWYIFPQLKGLGFSSTAQFYGIEGLKEAKAYLNHPTLASRLIECCEVLLKIEATSAMQVFGSPDYLKLHSSMTLFYFAQDDINKDRINKGNISQDDVANSGLLQVTDDNIFRQVINKFYQGKLDKKTQALLNRQ